MPKESSFKKRLSRAIARLESRRQAAAEERRTALRRQQRKRRALLNSFCRENGYTTSQKQRVLNSLGLDLRERREKRDLEEQIRGEIRRAAEAESQHRMVSFEEWNQWYPKRRLTVAETLTQVVQALRQELDDDADADADASEPRALPSDPLDSAAIRTAIRRIRLDGTKEQKEELAKALRAVAGIRPGRRKRRNAPQDKIALMRQKKSEVQAKVLAMRRALRALKDGSNKPRLVRTDTNGATVLSRGLVHPDVYARHMERDVVIPLFLGWLPERRRKMLEQVVDQKMSPVEVAVVLVAEEHGVAPTVIRRLGRARVARERKRVPRVVSAEKPEPVRPRRKGDRFDAAAIESYRRHQSDSEGDE